MRDDAILSPEQEEAGLKAREISKQESAVVDKSQQLVNEPWMRRYSDYIVVDCR